MDVLGVLTLVAWLLIVIGLVALVLGFVPATRPRVGDTKGWGLTLVIIGGATLLLVYVIPALVG